MEGHKKPTGPPAHLSASVSLPRELWQPGEGSQEGSTHSLMVASPLPHEGGTGRHTALDPTEASGPPASSEPVAVVTSRQGSGAGEARMALTLRRAGRRS